MQRQFLNLQSTRDSDDKLAQQAVTDLTTRTQELRAQLESVTEQLAETELKLQRTQAQNLDIKRKLPEIIQMINNTSSEFDNQ